MEIFGLMKEIGVKSIELWTETKEKMKIKLLTISLVCFLNSQINQIFCK